MIVIIIFPSLHRCCCCNCLELPNVMNLSSEQVINNKTVLIFINFVFFKFLYSFFVHVSQIKTNLFKPYQITCGIISSICSHNIQKKAHTHSRWMKRKVSRHNTLACSSWIQTISRKNTYIQVRRIDFLILPALLFVLIK